MAIRFIEENALNRGVRALSLGITQHKHNESSFRPALAGPLYQQIQMLLREKILSGTWQANECLPNEAELARDYGVSVGTMRKALDLLGQSKLIVRRQGLGTFVGTASIDPAQRFSRLHQGSGSRPPAVRQLLRTQIIQPTVGQLELLNLWGKPLVIRYDILETAARDYVSVCSYIIPSDLFYNIHGDTAPDSIGPDEFLRSLLSRVAQCADKIGVSLANDELADQLGAPQNAPLLTVERLGYTAEGRPIFVSHEYTNLKGAHYSAIVQ